MKKLKLSAIIFSLAILISSCARQDGPQLVGHYKPNTGVAQKQNDVKSSNAMELMKAMTEKGQTGIVANTTDASPELKAVNSIQQTKKTLALTDKQEQKLSKRLEKMATKMDQQQATTSQTSKQHKHLLQGDESVVLYAILSILLPPLAVYLYEDDITSHFWISIILTLCFWIPGVIYALIITVF